jgi:hypothetical protein
MTYGEQLQKLIDMADDAIYELDLFLGPDTKERKIWYWCNADRRPDVDESPLLEDLM